MQISDITVTELDEVLALNEAAVPHVNSLDPDDISWFARHAAYFRVARRDQTLSGFLIGLGPGLDYTSPNYQYFCQRHEVFGYVDRVVVATDARRLGVATCLYEDFAASIRSFAPLMVCEVNIRPPNESSMAYHVAHGFEQVAIQETEQGRKEVALLEKRL